MIKRLYLYSLLLALLTSFTACQQNQAEPTPVVAETAKDPYVSSQLLLSVPLSTLKPLLTAQGFGTYSDQVKYGVSVYKMVYTTSYQGKEIKASGLVCIPVGITTPAPVISAQHGTIFAHREAPTASTDVSGFELLAAAGYITFMPDYIGFGESKNVFHPYYDQKHSALAVVDMLKAGRSFYKEQNLTTNNKLFLVGYSEGGYVTMAAQKEIETNPAHGLKVTASAAGAGGYDLTAMLSDVTSGQPYSFPAYLAYILQAYNYTNDWKRPLSELFQEPYASRLPGLFNGSNRAGDINNQLHPDPATLFAPAFFNGLKDANKEQVFKQALQDNSLTDWAPQSPTRLYHGTADMIVPYSNSEKTFAALKARGAKNITFTPIPGGAHNTSFETMLEDIIPWMQSFK
ncbi:alpha/beta fold hydrolase [Botryobacter ruber]|uniref:alpha/beta fold hydrolase n=1 Tax=Botryobacter ruber TaxID=2171629 RepID=UPI001F0C4943|nr:alpha/beta fold hydrolase [Botryobacter ruber]